MPVAGKCQRKELFVNGLYGVAECWTCNHRVDWKLSWTAYRTFCLRGLPCDPIMMWKNEKIQTTGSTASVTALHICKISNVCDLFWQIFWQIWPVFPQNSLFTQFYWRNYPQNILKILFLDRFIYWFLHRIFTDFSTDWQIFKQLFWQIFWQISDQYFTDILPSF